MSQKQSAGFLVLALLLTACAARRRIWRMCGSSSVVQIRFGKFVVFNVVGNKYRLIVVIHYDRQRSYVRHILTHKEYDLGK